MLQFCLFISTKGETQKAYAFGGGDFPLPTHSLSFHKFKDEQPTDPQGNLFLLLYSPTSRTFRWVHLPANPWPSTTCAQPWPLPPP